MNQQLQKLADKAGKTYGAWQKQMRRDGFTKREQLSADQADLGSMGPAARALFKDYQDAQDELDQEARCASQPSFPEVTGEGAQPPGRANGHLKVVSHQQGEPLPDPSTVETPDGIERLIVSPQRLADLKQLSGFASLTGPKPHAKVQELNEQHYVVTAVADHYVTLNRCVEADRWEGDTVDSLIDRASDDWAGLVFKTGGKNSPSFVLCNAAQSVVALAGDPLAAVALESASASQ